MVKVTSIRAPISLNMGPRMTPSISHSRRQTSSHTPLGAMSMSNLSPDSKPRIPTEEPSQDEKFDVSGGYASSNVWALKIPRFLLEKWEEVREAGVELGTLVVDNK